MTAKEYLLSIGLGHLDVEEPDFLNATVRLASDIRLEVQLPADDVDGCVWLGRGIDGYPGDTPEAAVEHLEAMLRDAEAEVTMLRRTLITLQGKESDQ
jgi:hypothetical protein